VREAKGTQKKLKGHTQDNQIRRETREAQGGKGRLKGKSRRETKEAEGRHTEQRGDKRS